MTESRQPPHRARWPWALALAPLVVLVGYAAAFKLGMPYWDSWELVPLLQKQLAGELRWADLWHPHNEHRLFVPWAILVSLAAVTGWNDTYEIALSVLAAGSTCALLLWQWHRTARSLSVSTANIVTPLIALLVFALSQWENWIWGSQFIFFLATLTAVAGLLLLANTSWHWWQLLGAAALGLVATFSFGTGLLVWPVGLIVLLWLPRHGRANATWLAAWTGVGATAYWMYFRDFAGNPRLGSGSLLTRDPGLGSFRDPVQQPLNYIHYVLNYLGSPVLAHDSAFVAGGLGVAAWLGVLILLSRRHWSSRALLAPYVALGVYALAGALLVGVSRAREFGPSQALSSRYITLSYPFWVSLVVLLALLRTRDVRDAGTLGQGDKEAGGPLPAAWPRATATAALFTVTVLVLVCSLVGARRGRTWRYLAVKQVREHALSGAELDDRLLSLVYPVPSVARARLEWLRQERLSLFRPR